VSSRERCSVLAVVLAAVIGCSACRETFEHRYATRREAERAGAINGGWIPSWTPPSARDIALTYNIDTNYRLLTFTFDEYATAAFRQDCSSLERTRVVLPRWTPAKWWPPELHGSSAASPGRFKFFACKDRGSPRHFVGIDEAAKRAFMWDTP
jgi:hypothetical protein